MKRITFFVLILAGLFVSCEKDPAPVPEMAFSYTGNTDFAPCFVSFSNATVNAQSYLWTFGDGTSSTEQNPVHLFTSGGTYNVILTATNDDGVQNSLTKQVVVAPKPTKCTIKQVTVTQFPATKPNGGGWDSNSGPDIYYILRDHATQNVIYSSGYFSDVTLADLPVTFSASSVTITSLLKQIDIMLYDDDGTLSSDYMGGFYFSFDKYAPDNGDQYPKTIEITSDGSLLSFKLSIEWQK